MTQRISAAFMRAKQVGRAAMIPYLMTGYPDRETVAETARALTVSGGADLLEIGIPFSDPLADGPTIQRTADASLAAGTTMSECIATVEAVREAIGDGVALVVMGYVNPVLQYGFARFARDLAIAGADGVIIADLPQEESSLLARELTLCGLALIPLVAPTTPDERIAQIVESTSSDGFVYCVAVAGLTGARAQLSTAIAPLVARIRAHTALPIAVGFGISKPRHVAAIAEVADGAVVASALLDHIAPLPRSKQPAAAADFINDLRYDPVRKCVTSDSLP